MKIPSPTLPSSLCSIVLVLGLAAGCDRDAASTSPDAGGQGASDAAGADKKDTAAKMFEARTASERGDDAVAVEIYAELCGEQGHAEACEALLERAASDADLKRRLCFDLNYTKAC